MRQFIFGNVVYERVHDLIRRWEGLKLENAGFSN